MRITALAGLFACCAIFAASNQQASAGSIDLLKTSSTEQKLLSASVIKAIEKESQEDKKPMPTIHEVGQDETLSSISEKYQVPWQRLFNKNEQIVHPDIIKTGDKVTIPSPDEELKERELPLPPAAEPPVTAEDTTAARSNTRSANRTVAAAPAPVSRGSVAGNTYAPGYCTWYAKNMRPDMPNNLGNADTWVARAAAQGMATGSVPRAGAIGQQGMHVVYVQSVNGDGTVNISEMNYRGLYVVSTRTVPAGNFQYIY